MAALVSGCGHATRRNLTGSSRAISFRATISSRRTTRSTASTSPNIRAISIGARSQCERRQIRLDQGDRRRRPRRRAIPGRIGTGPRRPACRMAPIISSIGAARRTRKCSWFEQNVPVEDDALPPVLDVEATPTSQTCHRHLERKLGHRRHAGDAGGDGAPLRKRPIIYTSVDFYEAILSRRRVLRLSDLGALDQTPSGRALRLAQMAFLAVPVRRQTSRASSATSTRTPSTAQRSSGTLS